MRIGEIFEQDYRAIVGYSRIAELIGQTRLNDMELADFVTILEESITQRERDVLGDRFGLYGSWPKSLGETGREHGVTRERIRQIEARALAKLRDPAIWTF